jgi:lysyl-tRNA synthetase class 2
VEVVDNTKIFKNSVIVKSGSTSDSTPNTSSLMSSRTDFTKTPFSKIEFLESLQSAVGKTFPSPEELHREFIGSETNEIRSFLQDLCRQNKINISAAKNISKLLDKLFGHFIEPNLIEPTFVLNHPVCMSPLAKEHRSKPGTYV